MSLKTKSMSEISYSRIAQGQMPVRSDIRSSSEAESPSQKKRETLKKVYLHEGWEESCGG